MIDIKSELTRYYKELETKQLADIFIRYMQELGIRKCDMRRNDNFNTYWVDGKSVNWNRTMCHYYKETEVFANDDIGIILRKRAGHYLIIQRKGKRAFEIDYRGIISYDDDLLKKIIKNHGRLFEMLSESIRKGVEI